MKKNAGLLLVATVAIAALPAGYTHWTEDQIQDREKTLPAKMSKVKVATESLGGWGNHSMSLIHREGSGQAELHETQSDILIIRGGDGSIVIGGTIPDGKRTTALKSAAQRSKAVRQKRFIRVMYCTSRQRPRTRCSSNPATSWITTR